MNKQKRYFLYALLIALSGAVTLLYQEELNDVFLEKHVPQTAVENFIDTKNMAESGNVKAQYRLAASYAQGIGTPRNVTESNKWCMRSAEAGYALAQAQLGNLYEQGSGSLTEDLDKAVYWYEKAAAQNDKFAMQRLMLLYRDGGALGYDQDKFVYWVEKLHLSGDPLGTLAMAESFRRGKGRPQDFDKAVMLYESAAEQGEVSALMALGYGFYNGEFEVFANKGRALIYFLRAHEAGHPDARLMLSKMGVSVEGGKVLYSSIGNSSYSSSGVTRYPSAGPEYIQLLIGLSPLKRQYGRPLR